MTFTGDNGKRMRLWISEDVGEIKDKQAFMDMYVKRIVGVMQEPIDIYANATFLPNQIAAEYNSLWTPDRRQKVIDAAVKNDVAIEINNRYKIPSPTFLKAAKAAGAKFSFGTNNADANLGRLEYPSRWFSSVAWSGKISSSPGRPVRRKSSSRSSAQFQLAFCLSPRTPTDVKLVQLAIG